MHPSFPSILSNFTVADAWLLDWCYQRACTKNRDADNYNTEIGSEEGLLGVFRGSPFARSKAAAVQPQWTRDHVVEFMSTKKEDDGNGAMALGTLVSFGLLRQRQEEATEYQRSYTTLLLTPLGFCFAAACQPGLRDIYPDDIDEGW